MQSAKFIIFIPLVVSGLSALNAANISTSKSKFVTNNYRYSGSGWRIWPGKSNLPIHLLGVDNHFYLKKSDPFQYSYAVEVDSTVKDTRVRQSKAEQIQQGTAGPIGIQWIGGLCVGRMQWFGGLLRIAKKKKKKFTPPLQHLHQV